MRAMSIGELLVRVGAPLAVAVLFSSVILAGSGVPDRDLHLISPDGALSGRPMGLRALLIEGLEDPGRASIRSDPVDVRLVDDGRTVARTRLEPSSVAGLEGLLPVPEHARGALQVRAQVASDDGGTEVYAPVTLGDGAPRVPMRGRLASALQQYLPFAVRRVDDAEPPVPFEVRVVGGACVPEVPCRVLVWVGEPAASVAIEPTRAVTWEQTEPAAQPSETAGIEALTVVVHGPEGDLHLVASRDGRPVARRTVRLPVAQGAPVVRLERALARAPAGPALRLDGVEPGTAVLVDGFRNGYWERAGSTRVEDDGSIALPFPSLGPGVWRLQVRPDVLSVETVGTRLLSVHADGTDPASALRALAERTRALGFEDRFATAVLEGRAPAGVPLETQAAFLAANHELEIVPPPDARSSYVQRIVGAEATIDVWRVAAATGVLLVGLGVAVYLWWRGVRAGREARRILAESGEEAGADRSGRWTAIGAGVFVFLIFAVIALFVLSRSRM